MYTNIYLDLTIFFLFSLSPMVDAMMPPKGTGRIFLWIRRTPSTIAGFSSSRWLFYTTSYSSWPALCSWSCRAGSSFSGFALIISVTSSMPWIFSFSLGQVSDAWLFLCTEFKIIIDISNSF